jgi:hypothetical protein
MSSEAFTELKFRNPNKSYRQIWLRSFSSGIRVSTVWLGVDAV